MDVRKCNILSLLIIIQFLQALTSEVSTLKNDVETLKASVDVLSARVLLLENLLPVHTQGNFLVSSYDFRVHIPCHRFHIYA